MARRTRSVDTAAALARANLYRFLSAALLAPDDARFGVLYDAGFRRVVTAAADWLGADTAFQPDSFGPGELEPAELRAGHLVTVAERVDLAPTSHRPSAAGAGRHAPNGDEKCGLVDASVKTFGHSVSKDCPPYETEYCTNRDITFRSQRLADIAGFYRAFGLDRAEGARERVDHLSFEAEFMQIVIAREIFALDRALGADKLEVCRSAQRRFFVEHLGWWLPAFGSSLEEHGATAFYRRVGRFVRAFVAVERAALGVPPFTELPTAWPDDYEPEGACFSCGLGGESGLGATGPADAGLRLPDSP